MKANDLDTIINSFLERGEANDLDTTPLILL